jgi:hypothetical protein
VRALDSQRMSGLIMVVALLVVATIYWPGLSGGWLFDDFPNIVDNPGVQPDHISLASMVRAALSSPSSDFKRPLASLSFALNYLASGLDPHAMKLTNLFIHLLNGLLVFLLSRILLAQAQPCTHYKGRDIIAALIATSWLLLPINLTGVLYVVQRMESMANVFVLAGLIGYVAGRKRMLLSASLSPPRLGGWSAFIQCMVSLVLPTALGVLAKETAVMLPLYAFLIEWVLFRFRVTAIEEGGIVDADIFRVDWRLSALFITVLALPALAGITWLLPSLLNPDTWATRDFTLGTRLLSEARILVDYIDWTLFPTPQALSFYHDNFQISSTLLSPWTTIISIAILIVLALTALWLRSRLPLVSLGILLFLGCHLLTGTVLPLELIYEHRNYFASFGLLLATVPLLISPVPRSSRLFPVLALGGRIVLVGLMLLWAVETAVSAVVWGNPLKLADALAWRAPDSPRAEYELGRTYIIYSHYDSSSPFTRLAYAPLERASALPNSSILPQQALIFMNSRMRLPIDANWWSSMIEKLRSRTPTIQDESSLQTLVQCLHDQECVFPFDNLDKAFRAALSHPNPSARLLAMYGDFAWNELGDQALGERMTEAASKSSPNEPAYLITLARMLIAQGRIDDAHQPIQRLQMLNLGGRLSSSIEQLNAQLREKSK